MDNSKKKLLFQLGNILTPIIMMGILGILSLGQGDYRQIFEPAGYKSLLDPIGFAFAIWGPVFFFLILFLIYQARDIFKSADAKEEMPFLDQISVFFIFSTIMAGVWYVSWLNRIIWLATVSMIIYLVFLLTGYLRLDINRADRSRKEKLFVVTSWSMYTGWLTAATIVSATTFFVSIGFNNPPIIPDATWAILVLLVATIVYLAVLLTRNDYIFACVGIWAINGILFERLTAPIIVIEVIVTCIIGMILIGAAIGYKIYKNK